MNIDIQVLNADRKRIFRDPMLGFMVAMPIVFGLLLRYGLPVLRGKFLGDFDLSHYYPLIVGLFALTPALYMAAALSLQIIEEREERVLSAVAVTPYTLKRYFGIRLAGFAALSAVLCATVLGLAGVSGLSPLQIAAVAFTTSLEVPLLSLLMANYARNQVEGMVALKGTGLLVLPPLAMFFVSGHWHLAAGVLPAYWPIMAYYSPHRPELPSYFFSASIAVGIVYHVALIAWLFARFGRIRRFL